MNDLDQWFADGAEDTLRVDYPLTPDSMFYDVGGNCGSWTKYMTDRYFCHARIFEPVPEFHTHCANLFVDNPKVTVEPYALSDHNGNEEISVHHVDSSFFRKWEEGYPHLVPVRDVAEVFADIPDVDLISINCEGSEFIILPRLIETGLIGKFEHVQIQFHRLYPDHERLRHLIRSSLAMTHNQSYAYPFVWESWRIK